MPKDLLYHINHEIFLLLKFNSTYPMCSVKKLKVPHLPSAPSPQGEGRKLLIFKMNCDSHKIDYCTFI